MPLHLQPTQTCWWLLLGFISSHTPHLLGTKRPCSFVVQYSDKNRLQSPFLDLRVSCNKKLLLNLLPQYEQTEGNTMIY
jgi:hypothetical protein